MKKWIILITTFMTALIIIWYVIINIAMIKECPNELTSDYYTCINDTDCTFHPKYECINMNKELRCIIKEDLSIKQEAGRVLTCKCINNKCITLGNA